ncbi:glycerate 2-kinase [Sulfurisphaera javensis]|uniref:Glycerate 2-kinase n=1 Tax=Sulfurisphaera javensis TaxID=2049879 RepID=A0AAT9GNG1_9CREN
MKVEELVNKILKFSDPYEALEEKVIVHDQEIIVNSDRFTFKKPILIAVGKASYKMAKFFIDRMNIDGIVIVPKGSSVSLPRLKVIESTHPEISEDSIKAGYEVIRFLKDEEYDIVLFLLSGGASALMEYSTAPYEILREINEKLVKSGLSINEINVVRKHLSLIKGGKLSRYSKGPIISLIVSDVPGGDLSSVGSGPTVPDKSTVEDAKIILKRIGLEDYSKYLTETEKETKNVFNYLILDVNIVLSKLKKVVRNPIVLSGEVRGDAYSFGQNLAGIVNTSINGLGFTPPYTLLAGGEPDVKIEAKAGKGGRNGEVCLGFLKWVKKNPQYRFKLYAIATDGIDGNSEYAGCFIDNNTTIENIEYYISTHSSYEALEKIGNVIKTGYTYTNVNNIYVVELTNRIEES